MNRILIGLVLGIFSASCGDDAPPSANTTTTNDAFTKEQAATANGLTEDGQDICELMDWYADGVCDDFCDNTDADCAGSGVACQDSDSCPADESCIFEIARGCDVVMMGTCQSGGMNCTNNVEPVCGCDGKTYNTDCDAARAGVSVAKDSGCEGQCVATANCDPGFRCENRTCVASCGEGPACEDGSSCIDDICVQDLPATCNSTTACADGYFCYMGDVDTCDLSGEGTCQEKIQGCPENYTPVCGCDGTTYGNACEAAAAGANIDTLGECPRSCRDSDGCEAGEICENSLCVAGPVGCGARLGDTCQEGEFCSFTLQAGCGYADQTGVCAPTPAFCPDNIAPVCGCDQVTYNNECEANTAGTSAYTIGACQTTCTGSRDCEAGQVCENNLCVQSSKVCGGRSGGTCDALTEWCNYGGAANLCGQFDAQGTCDVRPQICTAQYDPVCGCDYQTYSNACNAHAAGVDIVSTGECAPI